MADGWRQHVEQWTQTDKFVKLIIFYENMMNNLPSVIKQILDFIEHPYTEDDINCVINSSNEQFHRKHSRIFDPYTLNQKMYIHKQISSINYILKQYNISYM